MPELFRERLPAVPTSVRRARRGVGEALTAAGISDPGLLADIALTVSEATTNAVRHAYPAGSDGHVDVTVVRAADRIVVTVSDEGSGMAATPRDTGGLGVGLALMHSQAERLEVHSDAHGTVVTLHFTLSPAENPHPS